MDKNCVINLTNLIYNLNQIKKHTNKKIIAVVKADAYGHGAVEISKVLEKERVAYLAVARISEALILRKANIKTPILILSPIDPSDISLALENDLTLTIFSLDWLKKITPKEKIKLHLKVDTGMNRLGLKSIDEIKEAISIIKNNENLCLEGIYTHYATVDTNDELYFKQRDFFVQILNEIDYDFKYIHTSASAALIKQKEDFTNAVRPGLALYGLKPAPNLDLNLKPILSLYSNVVQIKNLKKGEFVSYGPKYVAKKDTKIAVIPIGYGDGWLRRYEDVPVVISDKHYRIVGRICMDLLMVEVDDKVLVGDTVELIGPNITVDEIAEKVGTINYEVVTNLDKRLKRNYIR